MNLVHWSLVTAWGLLVSTLLSAAPAKQVTASASASASTEVKRHVWSLGFVREQHELFAGQAFRFRGGSGQVNFGYGYLGDQWFVTADAGFVVGPFNAAYDLTPYVDYQGTAGKLTWAYSPWPLRGSWGSVGVGLALGYADFSGRSYEGTTTVFSADPSSDHAYNLRVTSLHLDPTLFYCWLDKARTAGSTPAQLITRIEGYVVSLVVSQPIQASYKARFKTWRPSEAAPNGWREEAHYQHGALYGYTVYLGLTALLGS